MSDPRIRRAREFLRKMPLTEKIRLMVEVGLITQEQADRAFEALKRKDKADDQQQP